MNTIKLALTAFFTIAAAFGAQSETDETKIAVKDIRSIKYKNRTITLSPENLRAKQTLKRFKKELGITDSEIQK